MTQTSRQPSEDTKEKLRRYAELILKWNSVVDLTGVNSVKDISQNHIADAYLAMKELPEAERIIDIGTGAGFPGIVFAVFQPATHVHLIDSREKIGSFLEQVRMELMLSNVHVHIVNVEHFSPEEHGIEAGKYISVSRAFSPMEKLPQLISHIVKPGSPHFVISTNNSMAANPRHWSPSALELLKAIPYKLGASERMIFQVVKT